jgi:hypothetical protein
MLGKLVTSKVYKETQPMITKKVFSEFLSSSTEQEVNIINLHILYDFKFSII